MSTLVDAIYIRSVIHNPDSRGIFVYIVNTIYLMFNFFIVGTPLRFFHFLHTTIFIFIFVIISTLKQYFNGVMVYSFINWRSPLSAGLYTSLGVLFGVMAIWSLLVLLYLLRLKLAGESFDDEGKVKEVTPYDPFRESRA
ncbi:hypothetical protein LSH36_708g01129 [Paralvinella palmiformis]|uniref:Uncharacterized protein n=1 Tax=Paralvinella palmiformis TaxID=53620 RepID=A0AAD9MV65_9ANNE|nr:hypothetical protein LSH36_708g01129 [Paralvinella palmiformis]